MTDGGLTAGLCLTQDNRGALSPHALNQHVEAALLVRKNFSTLLFLMNDGPGTTVNLDPISRDVNF